MSTVLKSLIWQLCQNRDIPLELQTLFQRKHPEKPSLSDLRIAFKAILKRYGGDVETLGDIYRHPEQGSETYLIFDGLDELRHGAYRESMLGFIQDISRTPAGQRIHILLTSRAEKDISDHSPSTEGWCRYSIGRSKIQNDIALFVSSQISSHPKLNALPNAVKSAIRGKLIDASEGM